METGLVKILGPAMLYKDVVYSLPAPARHVDVTRLISKDEPMAVYGIGQVPGFYTDTDEFVDRKEAADIAAICRLLRPGVTIHPVLGLFTEDLW